MPGTADPLVEVIEDPPPLSILVIPRSPLGVKPISVTGLGLGVRVITLLAAGAFLPFLAAWVAGVAAVVAPVADGAETVNVVLYVGWVPARTSARTVEEPAAQDDPLKTKAAFPSLSRMLTALPVVGGMPFTAAPPFGSQRHPSPQRVSSWGETIWTCWPA